MKVIFLNIWKGIQFDLLIEFIKESAASGTDFFCFQEVFNSPLEMQTPTGGRSNIFAEICRILPDFQAYYALIQENYYDDKAVDLDISEGNAIFARKNISIDSEGSVFVFREKNTMQPDNIFPTFPCSVQYVRFQQNGKPFLIANFHGTSHPGSKLDTPDRMEQSRKILSFLGNEKGEKILGGDFNLMPDTQSIRMIEQSGMRNMIAEFSIRSTRSELALNSYPEGDRQYFADYVFVSPGIRIKNFMVPNMAVSDHLPLIMEFE